MIVRIWRTAVEPSCWDDYARFERERSAPMFRLQAGCLGVFFVRTGGDGAAAISLWEDQEAVDALARSPSYAATVSAIASSGYLRGEQALEVLTVAGGWASPELAKSLVEIA